MQIGLTISILYETASDFSKQKLYFVISNTAPATVCAICTVNEIMI